MDTNNFAPQNGMDVIGSDGGKIGEIDAVEHDYFIVRKGFFFPQDHYIPFSAVNSYEEGAVFLSVTKDEALNQEWTDEPVGTLQGDAGYIASDAGIGETVVDDTYGETAVDDSTYVADDGLGRGYANTNVDGQTIEVREEELHADTREVDRGSVRVDKRVVEEQRSIDVPVTEEEVNVTRRSVDREASGLDLEESTFEVPLHGEEVEVSKTARVVEEVDIDKTTRERTEHVTDTVRREEVDVTGDGVNADGDLNHGDDRGLLDKAKDAMNEDENNRGRY